MQAILGLVVILAVAALLSENRRQIEWRIVIVGLLVQFVLAFLFVRVTWIADALMGLNVVVTAIQSATLAGTSFLFGFLGGGQSPFTVTNENAMFLFAFRVLPQIIVFSVIIAVLWHWRVLPAVIRGFGWLLKRSLGVGGAIGTAGAASIFLGMVETPMVIRAYLAGLTRSEFFTVMTFGMSTLAGSVMVLYAGILDHSIDGVVGHILSASIINVFGAVYVARLLIPETAVPQTAAPPSAAAEQSLQYQSLMDAITRGTSDGLTLTMNVGAMLLVFVSLIALVNGLLGMAEIGGVILSLQTLLGWVFAPVAWLIGVPWGEAAIAGSLLGTKLVLNELVAFLQLVELQEGLSGSTRLIMLYALCGFANFGSLGILLGGLGALVPQRRKEFLSIAPRSLLSGTLVTLISGAIVGLVAG